VGVASLAEIMVGAEKLNVNEPSRTASASEYKVYETLYIPDSTSGFKPIVAETSVIVIVPSSTRTPAGSVTTISLASGSKAFWVVRVTDIGAVVIVDPLIGDVVISEFAPAVEIPKKAK